MNTLIETPFFKPIFENVKNTIMLAGSLLNPHHIDSNKWHEYTITLSRIKIAELLGEQNPLINPDNIVEFILSKSSDDYYDDWLLDDCSEYIIKHIDHLKPLHMYICEQLGELYSPVMGCN